MVARLKKNFGLKKAVRIRGGLRKILFLICLTMGMKAHGAMSFDFQALGKNSRIELGLVTNFSGGTIRGDFSRVVGKIEFPVESPNKASGQLELDAHSIRFGHRKVAGDAHSVNWLNSAKFPSIVFILQGMKQIRWEGKSLYATAFGSLSLKNRTVSLSVPLKMQYRRGTRRKYDGFNGDLLMMQGESLISRSQLGINSGLALDSVLDRVLVRVHLLGASNKVRPFLPSALFRR